MEEDERKSVFMRITWWWIHDIDNSGGPATVVR
jgi:hypothetical protein